MIYAGFWRRFFAFWLDNMIILLINVIVISIIAAGGVNFDEHVFNVIGMPISWLYFASLESSKKQATFGKRALGIKVVDMEGNPISFSKASGRFFGKILSVLIFSIGFIMVAFTEKKQGLHDKLSGCLVVVNNH